MHTFNLLHRKQGSGILGWHSCTVDCHSAWDGQDRVQEVITLEDEEVIGYESLDSSPAHLRPHFNRARNCGLVFNVKKHEIHGVKKYTSASHNTQVRMTVIGPPL